MREQEQTRVSPAEDVVTQEDGGRILHVAVVYGPSDVRHVTAAESRAALAARCSRSPTCCAKAWFTDDPTVSGHARACLRIIALGFLFYAYGMVPTQSFNGAGDTRTPTVINLFIYWLWEIPLGYVLAERLGLGPHGVFWAVMIAFSSLAVVSAAVFRRVRWQGSVV